MSTTNDETEDNKVFVGNLSFGTNEETLTEYFGKVGKVASATVIRRGRFRSAGYGFVSFEQASDAEKAVEQLNETELDERQITVQLAKPKSDEPSKPRRGGRRSSRRNSKDDEARPPMVPSKTRIYVANLPYSTTDEELAALFDKFTIDTAAVARLRNGRSKGYGFVNVPSEQDQLKIIDGFKDVKVGEREISVQIARVPAEGDAKGQDDAAPQENDDKAD
ncbi:hypothetical protein BC940DRAFT_302468 [Gongronella butleri]|nr:hypothetical protein BC940DRAFT_302468 [Gongronella butleri]